MHNNKSNYRYNGYSVFTIRTSPARRMVHRQLVADTGCFESAGSAEYSFDALDYFDNETQAVGHAAIWARKWVDSRG
jgi:hypothetical protein